MPASVGMPTRRPDPFRPSSEPHASVTTHVPTEPASPNTACRRTSNPPPSSQVKDLVPEKTPPQGVNFGPRPAASSTTPDPQPGTLPVNQVSDVRVECRVDHDRDRVLDRGRGRGRSSRDKSRSAQRQRQQQHARASDPDHEELPRTGPARRRPGVPRLARHAQGMLNACTPGQRSWEATRRRPPCTYTVVCVTQLRIDGRDAGSTLSMLEVDCTELEVVCSTDAPLNSWGGRSSRVGASPQVAVLVEPAHARRRVTGSATPSPCIAIPVELPAAAALGRDHNAPHLS